MTTTQPARMAPLTDRALEIAAFVRALDQLGHGAILLEGERITDASVTFSRLVGHDRQALLDMPSALDLIVPEQRESLREALGRFARGEQPPDSYTVNVALPSGGTIPLRTVVKAIEPGSNPPRLLVLVQDMTGQRGVQRELGLQTRMLESIAETSRDGILVVDGAGRMTYFNRRFVELWEIPAEVVASRSDDAALAAVRSKLIDPAAFVDRVAYLYAHPTQESLDELRLHDGKVIDRYSAPIIDREGQVGGRVWFFREVTAERRAEESRDLLARLGELLGASLEVDATLDQIAHAIVPLFADWTALDILDQTGAYRRIGVAHIDPLGEETLRQLDERWPLVPESGRLRGRVVATREPVTIYDVTPEDLAVIARDSDHRRLLEKLGMASAIWVPLIARERVLGVVSVGRGTGRHRFQPTDLELLGEIARRSALAIDNALLYREVQRGEARQAALAAIGARALAGEAVPVLLDQAAALLVRTMDADFSEILELAPDGDCLRLVAGEGWRAGRVGVTTLDTGKGSQGGYTLATVGPVVVDDLSSETRFQPSKLLLEHGVESGLTVVLGNDPAWGAIGAFSRRRHHFAEDDIHFVQALANTLAAAVDRKKAEDKVQRGEQRQAALAQLGARALAGEAVPVLLDQAAALLVRTMDADFSEILEMAPDGTRLRLVAGEGWRKGRVGSATVGIGKGSQGGYTLATVGPVVVDDLSAETRFRPSKLLAEHGVQSGLTVVVGGSPPWGALGAFSRRPRHFAQDDINFVQALANTLASAIERKSAEDVLARVAGREMARAAELKAVIESIGDAVVVCDAAGRVALANPAAEGLFGRSLGQGMRAILRSFEWPGSSRAPAVAALKSGVELRLVRGASGRRGRGRWMELSVYPVLVGSSETPGDGGTILVMRDVTAARESRQVREAFLGILSHELRSPVTTIYGGAEVLSRESPPSEEIKREIYADLRAEADRLYRLVENLLVLSRVERDGIQLEPEPVLLQRVLPRIIRSEGARWLGVEFEFDIPPGLPPVAAEETYLEQILQNLLGNAAKYGGSRVVVRLSEEPDETGGGAVVVRVQDNGPGFAQEDAEHMFEVFYRSPSATQRASGAGIGLFVSQQLVKAMGGRIWARNLPEGGAEFGFAVPFFED